MNPQNKERYFHDVALIEKHSGEIFYNKLGFKFLEIANFAKTGDQLETNMDKWLYLLKHMGILDRIPYFLDNRIFRRIFQLSEVANLNKEEQMHYEDRFMIEWDREAVLEWAKKEGLMLGMEQGLEQGLEQGKTSAQKAMIRNLISGFGFTDEQAANAASVSIDFVRQIRLEMNQES